MGERSGGGRGSETEVGKKTCPKIFISNSEIYFNIITESKTNV